MENLLTTAIRPFAAWSRAKYPRRALQNKKYFLSACLIAKNEGAYILEWIAYHRVVGFDYFYIYDNDSNDGLSDILKNLVKNGICEVISWPRSLFPDNPQVNAYFHCLKNYGNSTEWLATIDADEFIVPLTSDSVSSILAQRFSQREAIVCNWRIFGSAGHLSPSGQLCIERFNRASEPSFRENTNIKSIFRPEYIEILCVHNHYMKSNNVALSDGSSFSTPREQRTQAPVYGHLQINHYFGKSRDEYAKKILKFFADHPIDAPHAARGMDTFIYHDRNECLEDTILRFLSKTKHEIDFLKQLM